MSVEAPAPGSAAGFPERALQPDSRPQAVPGAGPAGAVPPGAASLNAVAQPRCDNCGASVPGRYCGDCGQRLEPPVHSLGHFAKVAAEDLTHADSRLWRTLGTLLVKPGMLTREFLAGRRARYLPPVRLYLVVSLVFFLWMAAHSANDKTSIIMFEPGTPRASDTAAPAGAAPPATTPSGATAATPPAADAAASAAAAPGAASAGQAKHGSRYVTVKSGSDPQDCNELAAMYNGPWSARARPLIRESCTKSLKDNGRSVSQALMHNLPRAMFVFLPLLAAVMMLFYWRPRRYYVEHLLFLLHNHVFVFVFVMLMWIPMALIPPIAPLIGMAGSLYMIWYVYRAMRAVYAQGRALTIAKMLAMSFVYLIFGVLMLTITALYSAITS